jgi:hypothetical protein
LPVLARVLYTSSYGAVLLTTTSFFSRLTSKEEIPRVSEIDSQTPEWLRTISATRSLTLLLGESPGDGSGAARAGHIHIELVGLLKEVSYGVVVSMILQTSSDMRVGG